MTCLFCGWFVKYDPRGDVRGTLRKIARQMAEHFSRTHGAVL